MTPLASAFWCEGCHAIGDSPTACPGCASRLSIYPLHRWIKKSEPETAPKEQTSPDPF